MTAVLKTMTSYRAMHVDGLDEDEILKHEFIFQVSKYDAAGNLLVEESFLPDKSLEHRSTYTYNEGGQLIEEMLEEGDGFISEHKTMEYDPEGKLHKIRLHYMDDSFDETSFLYDSNGRVIERSITDSDGEAGNRTVLTYEGDLLVSELEYDQEGEIISGKRFTYDDQGNLLTEEEEGAENFRLSHTYDENGKRSVSRKYNEEGQLVEKHTYTYDDQGRTVEVKDESRNGVEILKMEYDAQGNMIRQDSFNEKEVQVSSVLRKYTADNRIETTLVRVEGSGQRPPQDYRLRFEYEYYS